MHLSDLHIGKNILEQPLIDDQRYILDRIIDIIKEGRSRRVGGTETMHYRRCTSTPQFIGGIIFGRTSTSYIYGGLSNRRLWWHVLVYG